MNGPQLCDGSRVAVIGGGPAGSFFANFFLQMARRIDLQVQLDIYEPRDFAAIGPAGCNMCGGIVSESLVQNLASEGIHLPETVVQKTIDSYVLHMDVGTVAIATPEREKRIASVHRGGGPRGSPQRRFGGLDGHLLNLAVEKGANWVRKRVEDVQRNGERFTLKPQAGDPVEYDFVVVAVGVNSSATKFLQSLQLAYKAPRATKTYICEYCFGREMIKRELGTAMHVFLLNLPRLEFAALIPKGEYVTLCLLGEDLDKDLVREFLNAPQVKEALPANWVQPEDFCHCSPKISIASATAPYGDGIVFIGDCGATRLYKDGIGAAYRTAKAAAKTAVFKGISAQAFATQYSPVCDKITFDNQVGKFIFAVTRLIQKQRFARRAIWSMVSKEQQNGAGSRAMSTVLWDTFTGSAPYRSVLSRTLRPSFIGKLLWELIASLATSRAKGRQAA
jgi:flavin-dependent dehydrogenase